MAKLSATSSRQQTLLPFGKARVTQGRWVPSRYLKGMNHGPYSGQEAGAGCWAPALHLQQGSHCSSAKRYSPKRNPPYNPPYLIATIAAWRRSALSVRESACGGRQCFARRPRTPSFVAGGIDIKKHLFPSLKIPLVHLGIHSKLLPSHALLNSYGGTFWCRGRHPWCARHVPSRHPTHKHVDWATPGHTAHTTFHPHRIFNC